MALGIGEKVVLSLAVIVVGAPSLPITGGASAVVVLGALFAIWGVEWDDA